MCRHFIQGTIIQNRLDIRLSVTASHTNRRKERQKLHTLQVGIGRSFDRLKNKPND